jgi:MoaA/NifB/PqqE/SkfB family radical SAM enzyme
MSAEVTSPSPKFDGRVPFPEFASIETTMKCNLQCPMCLPFLDGSTVNGRHMDPAAFEQIARAVFPYVDSFQPTISGEPLLTRGLDRMLELAAEYGVRTEYYTNGTLLNDRMIAMVLPTLGKMCISFDGATKETFEVLRKGARFEGVVRNLERLSAAIRELPQGSRPSVGLAVTVMEKNVRELPALVELAHRLRFDFVSIAHLLPVVAEMQPQSLVHHVELAKEWIQKALDRAEALGVNVVVAPLDQVITAMAVTDRPTGGAERAVAVSDGFVEGLGERAVNTHAISKLGPPVTEANRKVVEERPAKRRRAETIASGWDDGGSCSGAPPPQPAPGAVRGPRPAPSPAERRQGAARPDSIWYCDFLWNRIYVTADATVRPCCVPGVPDIGDFRHGGLDTVWDNDAYRAMRIGLVRKEPVPVCKGCGAIKELTDPAEIDRALQGRALPARVQLPPVLLPVVETANELVVGTHDAPKISATPPALAWPAVEGCLGYEFRAASDEPRNALRFDTAQRGTILTEPSYSIPEWLWSLAPLEARVDWRAIARFPDERRVVARGSLVRVEPKALPVADTGSAARQGVVRTIAPPVVSWAPAAGGAGYAFEASLDDFAHVHFTTLEGGRVLPEPSYPVPQTAWDQVPRGKSCAWRALAIFPDRREVVARGQFVRD